MANFKTHLSLGIILGIICTSLAMIFNIFSDWTMLSMTILAVSIGSFLPDVDSDSSTPFRIVFYALGVISSIFSIIWITENYPDQWVLIIATPLTTFFVVRFIIGYIFKKFTHHRGIFHSIPMAVLFCLSTLILLQNFSDLSNGNQLIISLAIGIGFISHLVLDEVYSLINFNGKKFRPTKNLGSALKFWSNSPQITILVYVLNFILIYLLLTNRLI